MSCKLNNKQQSTLSEVSISSCRLHKTSMSFWLRIST